MSTCASRYVESGHRTLHSLTPTGKHLSSHAKEARAKGESEQRLFALPVWRETPFFSPREGAALAWTEAVTDIGRSGVRDALYDEARRDLDPDRPPESIGESCLADAWPTSALARPLSMWPHVAILDRWRREFASSRTT
jgi:Carboxymuconolactone decarboxylase family